MLIIDLYSLFRIWQHLNEITAKGDVTAILTTHYIEEARQANNVRKTNCYLFVFIYDTLCRYPLCDMVNF